MLPVVVWSNVWYDIRDPVGVVGLAIGYEVCPTTFQQLFNLMTMVKLRIM